MKPCHQWDDRIQQALQAQATRQGLTVAQDLSHVLIFFTVGYVVQRLHPDHTPHARRGKPVARHIVRRARAGRTSPFSHRGVVEAVHRWSRHEG